MCDDTKLCRTGLSSRTALFCAITYRSHLQGQFREKTVSCPETSVRNYHYSLRHNPEERSSHHLRGGSLKSRLVDVSQNLAAYVFKAK
jgi:hypothetical protein